MKVVLINDQLNPGGAEKVLVNTANLLRQKGVDVSVLLYLGKSVLDEQVDASIPLIYLHRRGRFDLSAMRSLKHHLKDVDIVHVHSRYNLRFLMVCKLLVGIGKAKIVFQEHIPILKLDRFTRYAFSKVDAYVAVLKTMCDWVKDDQTVNTRKVFYLPNIVSTPNVAATKTAYTAKKIVMVGNFMKLKNQLFAVELMKQLGAGYQLDIYGMVHQQDYYNELTEFIEKQNLQQQVRLIQGVTNIYDVLGDYEFAIHTSTQETGPLVLLEYMHAGLPFLTYATGDVAANLAAEIPEMIIESFTINDWKKGIETVVANAAERSDLQCRMKHFVEVHYTEERYWKQLQSIYKAVLN
jgi:glycosyltransferase involved in cell wall biosynthesis